jgi:hypothetical protein
MRCSLPERIDRSDDGGCSAFDRGPPRAEDRRRRLALCSSQDPAHGAVTYTAPNPRSYRGATHFFTAFEGNPPLRPAPTTREPTFSPFFRAKHARPAATEAPAAPQAAAVTLPTRRRHPLNTARSPLHCGASPLRGRSVRIDCVNYESDRELHAACIVATTRRHTTSTRIDGMFDWSAFRNARADILFHCCPVGRSQ